MNFIRIPFRNQSLTNAITLCLVSVLFLILSSCNSTRSSLASGEEEQGWEVVKTEKADQPSWIIYTRRIAGTNIYEYKIEGSIESSPLACITAYKSDILDQASNPDKKYPTYEITESSEDHLLTYVIHKEPFPFKDTEMRIRYEFHENENGMTGVQWKEAWNEHPIEPSKKLKRVESFRGSWNFTATTNNSCQAVNIVQFELKGVPLWFAEPMVINFLKGGMEDLRTWTSE